VPQIKTFWSTLKNASAKSASKYIMCTSASRGDSAMGGRVESNDQQVERFGHSTWALRCEGVGFMIRGRKPESAFVDVWRSSAPCKIVDIKKEKFFHKAGLDQKNH
jgi:hypothetical protein